MKPSKLERLIILMEECAEVQQVISKIIRHGEHSFHPNSPDVTNKTLLENELRDLISAIVLLDQENDINIDRIENGVDEEYIKRKNKYLHFNSIKRI